MEVYHTQMFTYLLASNILLSHVFIATVLLKNIYKGLQIKGQIHHLYKISLSNLFWAIGHKVNSTNEKKKFKLSKMATSITLQ